MSIQRLTLKQAKLFNSAKDWEELKEALIVNVDNWVDELRSKCICDTSVVPVQVSGSSVASTSTVATSSDIDQTIVLGMMLRK